MDVAAMFSRDGKWVLLCLSVAAWGGSPGFAAEAKKPNVLFFFVDDLRPELGCYGHYAVQTPNIDGLAKAGVRFERAYCQYPLCNPSRTSLLNGRYPSTTGVIDNTTWFGALHPEFVSLPKHFKANGYASLRTGKIFHGGIDDTDAWTEGGEKRDFEGATRKPPVNAAQRQQNSDRIVGLSGNGEAHQDYKIADRAIEYLKRYHDTPFFLACGFTKPHSPPTAPKRFFDMYDPAQVKLPVDFAPEPTVPQGFPKNSVTKNGDLFINRTASDKEAREVIRAYWASLTWTDWNVGRVLAELDKQGLRDNTVVVFWGDHGYHLGEKGKWSKHGSLFEVGDRVPLIVIAPGAKGNGQACPRVVQTLDLYPTLTDLCGLPQPPGLEGRSLKPLLNDPRLRWDYPAFTFFGKNNIAIRTERYRYVEYQGGKGGALLFDEQNDPHELKNLADDPQYTQIRAELSAKCKQLMKPN